MCLRRAPEKGKPCPMGLNQAQRHSFDPLPRGVGIRAGCIAARQQANGPGMLKIMGGKLMLSNSQAYLYAFVQSTTFIIVSPGKEVYSLLRLVGAREVRK